jgi:hypothetical protein
LRYKILALLLIFSLFAVAQQSSPSEGSSAPSSQTPAQSQLQPIESGQPRLTKVQAKQALTSPDFTPQVAQALLERLAYGLETHNASKTRSVFDPTFFDSQFFNRLNAAFDHFESFRVYYHVDAINFEDGKGDFTADFRLEAAPRESSLTPRRANTTLRFTSARTASEWRIIALDPQNFLFEF